MIALHLICTTILSSLKIKVDVVRNDKITDKKIIKNGYAYEV